MDVSEETKARVASAKAFIEQAYKNRHSIMQDRIARCALGERQGPQPGQAQHINLVDHGA